MNQLLANRPREGFRGGPLLCRMLRSTQVQVQEFANATKSLSVRPVAGKSLMSVTIVVENTFRPYNGRSDDHSSGAVTSPLTLRLPCADCVLDPKE